MMLKREREREWAELWVYMSGYMHTKTVQHLLAGSDTSLSLRHYLCRPAGWQGRCTVRLLFGTPHCAFQRRVPPAQPGQEWSGQREYLPSKWWSLYMYTCAETVHTGFFERERERTGERKDYWISVMLVKIPTLVCPEVSCLMSLHCHKSNSGNISV